MPKANSASVPGYELKVSIVGTEPPVWRTVHVSADTTLAKLHRILQAAFAWENYHLHEFVVGDVHFGPPSGADLDMPKAVDERKVMLADLSLRRGRKLTYLYDFGDSWEHEILVTKILDEAPTKPACVAGERAGPPEDCGGAWGYNDLLAALSNPKHERHDELREWIGDGYVPEAFDAATTSTALRRVR